MKDAQALVSTEPVSTDASSDGAPVNLVHHPKWLSLAVERAGGGALRCLTAADVSSLLARFVAEMTAHSPRSVTVEALGLPPKEAFDLLHTIEKKFARVDELESLLLTVRNVILCTHPGWAEAIAEHVPRARQVDEINREAKK